MFLIIGILTAVIIPLIYYRYMLGKQSGFGMKNYCVTFLKAATLYVVPIIILELAWDAIFMPNGAVTLRQQILSSTFRAALLEESVKFFWAYRLVKRHRALGLKECMLIAGLVGIGYGFTEKLVLASGTAMIATAVVPGHMFFQWIMGYFLYKAFAGTTENGRPDKKFLALAYIVPFCVHTVWDISLDIAFDGMSKGGTGTDIAVAYVLAAIIVSVIAGIIAARKIKRIDVRA